MKTRRFKIVAEYRRRALATLVFVAFGLAGIAVGRMLGSGVAFVSQSTGDADFVLRTEGRVLSGSLRTVAAANIEPVEPGVVPMMTGYLLHVSRHKRSQQERARLIGHLDAIRASAENELRLVDRALAAKRTLAVKRRQARLVAGHQRIAALSGLDPRAVNDSSRTNQADVRSREPALRPHADLAPAVLRATESQARRDYFSIRNGYIPDRQVVAESLSCRWAPSSRPLSSFVSLFPCSDFNSSFVRTTLTYQKPAYMPFTVRESIDAGFFTL